MSGRHVPKLSLDALRSLLRRGAQSRDSTLPAAAQDELAHIVTMAGTSVTSALYATLDAVGRWLNVDYVAVWARDDDAADGPTSALYSWPRGSSRPREIDLVQPILEHGFGATGDDGAWLVVRRTEAAGRAPGRRRLRQERTLMTAAAQTLAVLLSGRVVRAAFDRAGARRGRLVRELDGARHHLARAHDQERRALVTEILGIASPRLAAVGAALPVVEANYDLGDEAHRADAERVVGEMTSVVENLAELFRGVVTSAHSTVLRQRGLRAAISELAAVVPRRVDLSVAPSASGTGTAPELRIAVYHLLATLLRESSQNGSGPVQIALSASGGVLVARVDMSVNQPDRMRALVAVSSGHAQALGGRLQVGFDERECVVRLVLPQDLGPVSDAVLDGAEPPGEHIGGGSLPIGSPLPRVRGALVAAAMELADAAPDAAAQLRGTLRRLERPVRVGFVAPDLSLVSRAVRVVLSQSPPQLDVAEASWLTYADGGGLGAVVRAGPDHEPVPDIRSRTFGRGADGLRQMSMGVGIVPGLAGAGMLSVDTGADAVVSLLATPAAVPTRQEVEGAPWRPIGLGLLTVRDDHVVTGDGASLGDVLSDRLLPWADVLVARSALHSARECVRRVKSGAAATALLDAAADRCQVIRELEALSALWHGAAPDEPRRETAYRLLGAHGRDVASRLDLPASTTYGQARGAIISAVAYWKTAADRDAVAATVTETCERLLDYATRHPHRRLDDSGDDANNDTNDDTNDDVDTGVRADLRDDAGNDATGVDLTAARTH